jgi:tetratricopeptide (TPR) repeat protein
MTRTAAILFVLSALAHGLQGVGLAQEARAGKALEELRREVFTSGRPADTTETLREFITTCPERYEDTLMLARTWMSERMFAEAAELLEEAVKKWPKDFELAELLGTAYLELGRSGEAVAAWHSALGRSGSDGEGEVIYYMRVSRLEWDAGMYDRAIETLKEARKHKKHYRSLTAAIVRMEKTRGNDRGAFMEALYGMEIEQAPDMGRAAGMISSFRDSGSPQDLIEAVDSIATHGSLNEPFFRTLHAALLVETGDYGGASLYLQLAGSGKIPEKDLYAFVLHLYSLGGSFGDPAFEGYLEEASSLFVRRFGASARAPRILLEGAGHAELAAGRGGAGERTSAARAVSLADSTMSHRRGRPYAERARLIKARVQLEHMHDPGAALRTVDSGAWRHPAEAREAQGIRLEALMLSGRWDEAMERFEALAASPDTALAVSGKYGKGMVLFYGGSFEESAKVLSEVAAEAPGGKWANDALATAVLIRRAEMDDPAILAAFASAMTAGGNGRYGEAADSLAGAAARYPGSPLAPEALYESALVLERAGRRAESVAVLKRISEEYPLSRVAPRAVETLAALLEDDYPEESARWYALFLERYEGDPWVTRVRSRYMRHRSRTREDLRGEEGDT